MSLAPETAQALYVNTQRWLRRHGLADVDLSVSPFGLDQAAQSAADTALALDTRLAYLPETLQATPNAQDLTTLFGDYLPSGSTATYSLVLTAN